MIKAKVYAGWVNGTWTEIKAYKKAAAVKYMREKDKSVKSKDIIKTNSINSHQVPVDAEDF